MNKMIAIDTFTWRVGEVIDMNPKDWTITVRVRVAGTRKGYEDICERHSQKIGVYERTDRFIIISEAEKYLDGEQVPFRGVFDMLSKRFLEDIIPAPTELKDLPNTIDDIPQSTMDNIARLLEDKEDNPLTLNVKFTIIDPKTELVYDPVPAEMHLSDCQSREIREALAEYATSVQPINEFLPSLLKIMTISIVAEGISYTKKEEIENTINECKLTISRDDIMKVISLLKESQRVG